MILDRSRSFFNPYILQAIKDVRADQDTLIDLFGRMESFFMRLEKYVHFRPTAAMMDIIAKIMVEVILILGIVTKELRQGQTSMPFLIYICYVTAGTFARRGLSSTAKTLRSLVGYSRF